MVQEHNTTIKTNTHTPHSHSLTHTHTHTTTHTHTQTHTNTHTHRSSTLSCFGCLVVFELCKFDCLNECTMLLLFFYIISLVCFSLSLSLLPLLLYLSLS